MILSDLYVRHAGAGMLSGIKKSYVHRLRFETFSIHRYAPAQKFLSTPLPKVAVAYSNTATANSLYKWFEQGVQWWNLSYKYD